MGRILFGLLVALGLASPAIAQIDRQPKVHARLIAERGEVAPGGTVAVALEETIRPTWHTYWRNPGDAGAPTEIKWTLPPEWRAGPIAWPYPKELPVGPLMDYGYEGKVWLLSELKAPPDAQTGVVTLKADVDWLVCQRICVPEEATLSLPISVGPSPPPPYATVASAFSEARAMLPVASPWPARFALRDGIELFVASPLQAGATAKFFPFDGDAIKGIAPQDLGIAKNGFVLRLEPGKHGRGTKTLAGIVELTSQRGVTRAYTIAAVPGAVPPAEFAVAQADVTLPMALLFALLGGLILNLMPCVLPILAMKALSVASHAGKRGGDAAREGLAYGAGAVASFAVLGMLVVALRASGAAVGWGFQLQEPIVVALFALLIFAVGLNFSGVYEFPGIGAGDALARRGGMLGAFFTGVLAVAVAAPCTAPFMAAALGFALTQSDAVAFGVFAALGIGFAAPFVLLAMWPGLRRLLPSPGAWMATFKQLLAFPMYATALWLGWVLSVQSDSTHFVMLLIAALVLTFALWAVGAAQRTGGRMRLLGYVLLVVALAALPSLFPFRNDVPHAASMASVADIPAETYSQARLESLRAQNRPIFVNATAAWCVTCLVNEKIALDDRRVRDAFALHRVAYLVADWTRRDPEVSALLATHGRDGVPLYVYYAPGAARAAILPQILTPRVLLRAIDNRESGS